MTETRTVTLGDFLLARITEDEEAARTCARVYPAPWDVSDRGWQANVSADAPNFYKVAVLDQDQAPGIEWLGSALEHIARHDPARVLAECEAKRRIVEECTYLGRTERRPTGVPGRYDVVTLREPIRDGMDGGVDGEAVLLLMALPYADHPDYRPAREWRP